MEVRLLSFGFHATFSQETGFKDEDLIFILKLSFDNLGYQKVVYQKLKGNDSQLHCQSTTFL